MNFLKTSVVVLCLVLFGSSTAQAQFGGGGFDGGGNGFFAPPGLGADLNRLDFGEGFVVRTNSKRSVVGFSGATGKMDRFTFEKPIEKFVPIASGTIVALYHDNTVLAFPIKTGRWIGVEVEEEPVIVVQPGYATFQIGQKIYACSSNSVSWQVIDLDNDG